MNEKQRMFKKVFLILFGVIALIFGAVLFGFTYSDKVRCTEKVDAVIVDIASYTSGAASRAKQKSYTPVFEYTYNGEQYTSHMDTYVTYDESWKGRKCEIYIDPKQPTYMYYMEITKVTLLVGGVAMLIGVIVVIKGIVNLIKE